MIAQILYCFASVYLFNSIVFFVFTSEESFLSTIVAYLAGKYWQYPEAKKTWAQAQLTCQTVYPPWNGQRRGRIAEVTDLFIERAVQLQFYRALRYGSPVI